MYNEDIMNYEFSWGWFLVGIIILIAGAVFVRYYQWFADNFGSGVGSYDKFRLYGLIACIVGLIVAVSLHTTILRFVLGAIFPG